jgi:3-hydroxyacyl-CoA dehydrogenase
LVIGNQAANSVGANIGMIFMMAVEQEYARVEYGNQMFQDTMMRVRYLDLVVVAPQE